MKVTCCHVLSLAALLSACGGDPAPGPPSTPAPAPAPTQPSLAELTVDADRRVATQRLRGACTAPDPDERRAAVRALARVHSIEEVPRLLAALRDTDPETRAWASFGLGAFETEASEGTDAALLRALAAEPSADSRALLLRDLARLRSERGLEALEAALRSDESVERAAACHAAAEYGLGQRNLPRASRSRIAALIGPEEPVEVRLACAYALARLPAPAPATTPEARRSPSRWPPRTGSRGPRARHPRPRQAARRAHRDPGSRHA